MRTRIMATVPPVLVAAIVTAQSGCQSESGSTTTALDETAHQSVALVWDDGAEAFLHRLGETTMDGIVPPDFGRRVRDETAHVVTTILAPASITIVATPEPTSHQIRLTLNESTPCLRSGASFGCSTLDRQRRDQ